jgi:uncharacterized protein YeaO (DUF488 family)
MIAVKRAYEPPSPRDGRRILVDRLWPRGLSRQRAQIDEWTKDLAPSDRLRKWFGHDLKRWAVFRQRYRAELGRSRDAVAELAGRAARERITLVFGARDPEHNNAVVLKELLEELQKRKGARHGDRREAQRAVGGRARGSGDPVAPDRGGRHSVAARAAVQ